MTHANSDRTGILSGRQATLPTECHWSVILAGRVPGIGLPPLRHQGYPSHP